MDFAGQMRLDVQRTSETRCRSTQVIGPVLTARVPPRNKRIEYDAALLPELDRAKQYAASDIVTAR